MNHYPWLTFQKHLVEAVYGPYVAMYETMVITMMKQSFALALKFKPSI